MRKIQGILLALTLGIASMAHAQATRTWVSGVGDDANPCSRTAPCKTFAGAISKTATGGIINAIDSAGFGAVTITKAITIDASPFMGGVLQSGATAILVNATSTSPVSLRGLDVEGVSGATNGIRVLAASTVTIENCSVYGFQRGISLEGTVALFVNIFNTTIRNNSSHGIACFPTGGTTTRVNIDNARVVSNGSNGFDGGVNTEAYISRSNFSGNTATGILAEQGSTYLAIESTTIARNANGVFCGLVGAPTCVMSRNIVTKNTTNGVARSGDGSGATGTILGFQSNVISNNTGQQNVSSSTAGQ